MQPVRGREFIKPFKIAKSHARVPPPQRLIKHRIALGIVAAAPAHGSIERKYAVLGEHASSQFEHAPHGFDVHDVSRIGREDAVKFAIRAGYEPHVDFQRLEDIAQTRLSYPRPDSRKIFINVARLPNQVGQFPPQVHRMLAGA